MKRRSAKGILAIAMAVVLTAALPFGAFAGIGMRWVGEDGTSTNGGYFSDTDNFTWTANDGTVSTYGRGQKFSDVRPDVTDPEYFLKEANLLESGAYAPEIVAELRAFVNSFDWIHSDELTRANMVHDRISNGHHGNVYKYPEGSWYSVLMTGTGQCRDFSGEFKSLAKFVGLECEVYTPSDMHQACLIKISGQWFAIDPTASNPFFSNDKMHPVDYETEYYRWEKEVDAKWEAEAAENPDGLTTLKLMELNRQLAAGIITNEQFEALVLEAEKNDMNKLLAEGTITIEQYNNYFQK